MLTGYLKIILKYFLSTRWLSTLNRGITFLKWHSSMQQHWLVIKFQNPTGFKEKKWTNRDHCAQGLQRWQSKNCTGMAAILFI